MYTIVTAAVTLLLWIASIYGAPLDKRVGESLPTYNLPSPIANSLGPYSARYVIDSFGGISNIPLDLPIEWQVSQVNIIARHGARYPTSSSKKDFNSAIAKVQKAVKEQADAVQNTPLAFMTSWNTQFGADSLVDFGRKQAYYGGVQVHQRYPHLVDTGVFIRSNSKDRVLESSRWFKQAFLGQPFGVAVSTLPMPDLSLPSGSHWNNTLSMDNCEAAEKAPEPANPPHHQWRDTFAPPIAQKLAGYVPGLSISAKDVINLMSICGFETALHDGNPSPWCGVFSDEEFAQNEYYYDLQKYYDESYGSPYAKAQGAGWVNELIARLTGSPVVVTGAINRTLDEDPQRFPIPPLAPSIFADFSSDNNIAHIIAALGILEDASPLSADGPQASQWFIASKAVPFSTNLAVEKLSCSGDDYVRIILNDAVVPLQFEGCGLSGMSVGICPLDAFVEAQAFSQGGADFDRTCQWEN